MARVDVVVVEVEKWPGAGKRRRFPQRALALTRPTPHLALGLLPMPGIIVKSDFK